MEGLRVNNKTNWHYILIPFFVLTYSAVSHAQILLSGLEGQISVSEGTPPGRLSVEALTDNRFVDRTFVAEDGSFRFRNLPRGWYEIRVVTFQGDVLRREFVSLAQGDMRIDIRIPGAKSERPANGSVSIRSLLKPTPPGVRKELQRSEKAFLKGDTQGSLDHLRKALNECADCVEVHNNLGVRYMRMGAFGDAVTQFRTSVELDPGSVLARSNLAIALVAVKDYAAAEAAAGDALRLDRGSVPARYALGLAGLAQGSCSPAVLDHLKIASDHFARARLSLASAFVCRGETKLAIAELTSYLEGPAVEHREQVQNWLRQLRAQVP